MRDGIIVTEAFDLIDEILFFACCIYRAHSISIDDTQGILIKLYDEQDFNAF